MTNRFAHLDTEQLVIQTQAARYRRLTYAKLASEAQQDFTDLMKEISRRNLDSLSDDK